MWNVDGCDAQRAQQAHAADAQQNFLHDARGAVAAINAQGQIAEMLLVLRQVGVEQIDRHAADVDAPGLEDHDVHADFHAADEPLAVGVQHRFHRHVLRVNRIVKFRLPVVGVDRLLEIAFAVEQADADEAEAEVAGGFGVVAGEDAQAAGGDRQRFVEAELGGEIGDGIFVQLRRVLVAPGVLIGQIGVEILQHGADAARQIGVLQAHAQFVIGDFVQHGDGVVEQILPAARRKFVKKSCASWSQHHQRLRDSLFRPATSSFSSAPVNGFHSVKRLFLIAAGLLPTLQKY